MSMPYSSWHSRWARRVPFVGALIVFSMVAMAAFDVVRSHREAVAETGRQLDTQARIIAEQTARSLQAVDVVLRHIAQQYRQGMFEKMTPRELHNYLNEQAVGLVQIDGLLMADADGRMWASSRTFPIPSNLPRFAGRPAFEKLRAGGEGGPVIESALQSDELRIWVFPIGRRLETASGDFAGVIGARGRIDYYQKFYRDIQLGPGTITVLMHQNGTLLARQPSADSSLGKRLPLFDERLAAYNRGSRGAFRTVSPVDGVERIGAMQLVPDYPLAVIATRDVDLALAPWREQAVGTAVRTLALSVLAAWLILMVMRQMARLDAARESLAVSQERFAAAVAGSDDGIWDWDYEKNLSFQSARGREILGLPPGPEVMPMHEWHAAVEDRIHPDDAPLRRAQIEAHLAGKTQAYESEFRVKSDAGGYRWVRVRGLCVRNADGTPHRMAGSASDIDAAKRAEAALRESQERFQLAVEGSNDGIVDWDVVNDRMYSSKRAMEIVGIDSDVTVRTRAEWRNLVVYHPDDAERVPRELKEFLDGSSDLRDREYRVRIAEGEYRWIRHRNKCVRDSGGRPIRVAGSLSDIDAQKRAEEALRESEERFALAVAGANDGIVDWDIAGDRMFISERAQQIIGIRSESTVRTRAQWTSMLRVHPEDLPRLAESFRWVIEGQGDVREGEYRVREIEGTWRWIRVRGQHVRDAAGRVVRWAGSVSDIDAQKRAEEALRASEERFALAVAGANQGLWDWDLASDRMFMSPRAQSIMGFETGEPLRPRREWILLCTYHPEDIAPVRAAISDHLHGRTPHLAMEYRVRHPSGDWHWCRQRGIVLRDEAGKPFRMAGSMEEITDVKEAEARRASLEGELLQAKKLEAIGTLAGGIAHDFNNILAAILGYGEMAQKGASEGTPLRRHIDAVVGAGLRAKSLVERILAFSRSGIGERVPVHVQSVVVEALDLFAASMPAHLKLERRLAAGDATILGDPTQIHQVIMNLCANGAQAMKAPGALTVTLDVLDKLGAQAATSALPAGKYVRLAVSDAGSGIPRELKERIFDPFFTTKEVGVGTGLGLSLVHGIVTDLGGGIEVDSREGKGTTFIVYLPWTDQHAVVSSVEEAAPKGNGETILLVDDEEALVRLGEEVVAALGYEPVGFSSSSAALAAFRASPDRFSAVLSDESMPGMNGSDLAREIRAIRPGVPFVLMSGFVSPALAAKAQALGIAEVLNKPLVSRDIARSLAAALARARQTEEMK